MPINNFLLPGAKVTTAYSVANSCRFNDGDSPYMHKTCSSAFDTDRFTISVWCKRGVLGIETRLVSCDDADGSDDDFLKFDANDNIEFTIYGSSSIVGRLITNAKYRDVSAWYHIVAVWDSANGTAGNRMRLYVNGTEVTSFSTDTNPSSGANATFGNTSHPIEIGRRGSNGSQYFDGYLAEVAVCDGQAYAASDFGEFDEDSPTIWKPKDISGLTFGTSGFYLDFEDSSNLGNDANGGTDLTEVNLATTDQASDSPTNNFATWNPLWSQSNGNIGDVVFSEGNLKTTTSAHYRTFPATIGFSSGKWYWEIKRIEDDGNDTHTGVMSENATPAQTATWIGSQANAWIFAGDAGSTYTGNSETNTGYTDAGSADDIISVAFDADNGKIFFAVNGTWQGSADPAAGTNYAYSSLDTSLYYFPCTSTGSDVEGNFGNPSFSISSGNSDGNGYGNFEYSVPSGYYALCTKNLAEFG